MDNQQFLKKDISKYKRIAKVNLEGKWGVAIGVALLFSLLAGVLSFSGIGIIIIGPFSVGLALFFLRLTRKNSPKLNSLFEPFNNFTNSLVFGLLKIIFIMIWTLLLVIPGIIMSYSYAMSEYIMADDSSAGGMTAIKMSKKMMYGKKAKLFRMHFSIMGWLLIPSFALFLYANIVTYDESMRNIGFLWWPLVNALALVLLFVFLTPYYNAAKAAFYEEAKADYESGCVSQQQ